MGNCTALRAIGEAYISHEKNAAAFQFLSGSRQYDSARC